MEIRAGTGGDEAALFAADLFCMYSRYAEQRHWKMEVMSQNQINLGGYKEIIVDSRTVAVGFYEKLGYEKISDEVYMSGVFECVKMRKFI